MFELEFEWDSEKEQENIRERGIYFEDATQVFYDYFAWNAMTMIQAMPKNAGRQWAFLMMCFL